MNEISKSFQLEFLNEAWRFTFRVFTIPQTFRIIQQIVKLWRKWPKTAEGV